MHPTASDLGKLGILVLAAGMVGVFAAAWGAAARRDGRSAGAAATRAAAAGLGWMALTGAFAASGIPARFDARPPPIAGLFVATLALGLVLGLGRVGGTLARAFPAWALVLAQGFRFPLELVMHGLAGEGTMPDAMTWTGWNFDVLVGASALVVAPILRAGGPRALGWAWNLLGIAMLVDIAVVAFAASPVIGAFGPDQLNTFVAYVPFVWLPTVLVAAAIAGHAALTRRLLADAAAERSVAAESAAKG